MMKVLIVACVPGEFSPGAILDLPDDQANDWIAKEWAIPVAVEKIVEEVASTGEIESPEDELPEKENAMRRRRGKPYTT